MHSSKYVFIYSSYYIYLQDSYRVYRFRLPLKKDERERHGRPCLACDTLIIAPRARSSFDVDRFVLSYRCNTNAIHVPLRGIPWRGGGRGPP